MGRTEREIAEPRFRPSNVALDEQAPRAFDEEASMAARLAQIPEGAAQETSRPCSQRLPTSDLPCRPTWRRNSKRAFGSTAGCFQFKIDAGFKKLTDESGQRKGALESQKLAEPMIRALWDRGEPSPTYMYRRGDYLSPGRLVGPGVPSVLTDGKTPFEVTPPWPGAKKTGRRLALARWLTRPDHPLTARVMVNRIWKHHFGIGLVKTLDNFGKMGTPPTHPELLDWLAREFVRSGWSIKAMHRLMVTSATYRQTSDSDARRARNRHDPGNALYSRMPLSRLSADQLYDAMLLAAGRLDETRFGPADPVDARLDGLVVPRRSASGWRRSIYVQQQRKIVVTGLESFDFPLMNPNCSDRRDSTVVLQALHLMNNGMVSELAEELACRIESEAGTEPARQIERVYLVALGRASRRRRRVASARRR